MLAVDRVARLAGLSETNAGPRNRLGRLCSSGRLPQRGEFDLASTRRCSSPGPIPSVAEFSRSCVVIWMQPNRCNKRRSGCVVPRAIERRSGLPELSKNAKGQAMGASLMIHHRELQRAYELLMDSLELRQRMDDREGVAWCLDSFAELPRPTVEPNVCWNLMCASVGDHSVAAYAANNHVFAPPELGPEVSTCSWIPAPTDWRTAAE